MSPEKILEIAARHGIDVGIGLLGGLNRKRVVAFANELLNNPVDGALYTVTLPVDPDYPSKPAETVVMRYDARDDTFNFYEVRMGFWFREDVAGWATVEVQS